MGSHTSGLVILDIMKLFASDLSFPAPLAQPCVNVLVVGLDEDSDSLVSAWNEDIPTQPIECLKTKTLLRMMANTGTGGKFYGFFGRLSARRVHSFLTRRLGEEVLTDREKAVVALIRCGYHNKQIEH